ncbi:MAG TPA: extracellular solute-binding protein [Chloroflexota bacterium]|nr:extracellular solute-binding protein [Chloroflexota bacterium]
MPAEWDAVVAAGKREGKVSLIGPPGDTIRASLVDPFEKQYGITVDYNALPGNQVATKVGTERAAGQYNWDVLIAGSAGTLEDLIPIKAVDPIDSVLILPDVKDPKNWRGGALPEIGPNHEILVMTPYQRGTLFYNKTMVKDDEITSYKDLLDPKWNGKMQLDDPRRPGPGQATFIFFYLQPDLGADFIQAIAKQNITLQNDYQTEVDSVGQGRTPLMIGAADNLIEARIKQGAPIGIVPAAQLKEGTDVSSANGNVSVFNKAAHPNATKVYVNWLLTQQEQEVYAKANGFTDARVDVNGDWTEPWRVPAPNAIRTDGEVAVSVRSKLNPLLAQVFSS